LEREKGGAFRGCGRRGGRRESGWWAGLKSMVQKKKTPSGRRGPRKGTETGKKVYVLRASGRIREGTIWVGNLGAEVGQKGTRRKKGGRGWYPPGEIGSKTKNKKS